MEADLGVALQRETEKARALSEAEKRAREDALVATERGDALASELTGAFADLADARQAEAEAGTLVEKFDTELISDFSAKSSNFRRLVLSCINADFCVQILILQRFSRSTRFSHLCTARNSKSSQFFVKILLKFIQSV